MFRLPPISSFDFDPRAPPPRFTAEDPEDTDGNSIHPSSTATNPTAPLPTPSHGPQPPLAPPAPLHGPTVVVLPDADAELADAEAGASSLAGAAPTPPPRRYPPVACDFCRQRKLRCDGTRPRCSNCTQRNFASCVYAKRPCESCRARNLACDEQRPACGNCAQQNQQQDCFYRTRTRKTPTPRASRTLPSSNNNSNTSSA
ncbi:Zn(2)-C6 fungal-type domain-containing protein [Mycena kentingensis (nom. inval.)]|nr:Zn(2)-C6 fungal-type domain-containing protein [Mycena kentingensis (nom. inval.)]